MRLRLDKLVLSAGLALAMVATTIPVGAAITKTGDTVVASDGYMDAKNSGRNNYVGDWRCVWMNTSIYVPQQFRTEFVLMWQNDDGSIDILMNVQNGKDKDMQVLEWRMDAQTEGSDGYSTDIFKIDYAGDGTKVPANSSMNMIVHVNKEDVLTGTDKWEFAGFSMQNAYE